MKKLFLTLGIVAVAAILVTTASARNRGVEFIDLGTFGDTFPFGFTITPDGSKVGGSQGGGLANCIAWDESSGMWSLVAQSDGSCYMSKSGMEWGSALADVDGVSHMSRYNPMTMQQEVVNELPELAPCDFFQSDTFGISGDGKTLVGLGWAGCTSARAITSFEDCNDDFSNPACIPGGEMTRYESFPADNTRSNRMNAADQDGSVLVGWQDTEFGSRYGAKWVDGAAIGEWFCQPDDPFNQFCGEAFRTNSDGSAIAGGLYRSPDTMGIAEGWVWTETDGIRGTGQLPGAFFLDTGFNFAISEDGRTTGGRFGFGPFSSATLWTEATGIINLNQFLIDQGRTEPFDGWFMVQVNDMSGTGGPDDRVRLLVWAANPDFFLGNQSVIIDISKVSVCHAPPGNPESARTLNISWGSVEDHVGHGDFLGTCEAAGGGFSRAASASDFFGVDPTNECFQSTVSEFMATHSPIVAPSADDMERMIAASSGDCQDRVIRRHEMTPEKRIPDATGRTKRRVRPN